MTDIVKGMIRKYEQVRVSERSAGNPDEACQEAMRAALLFLADNVSDEMIEAALDRPSFKHAISAAIRAAAEVK
jgi:hypothetical protein